MVNVHPHPLLDAGLLVATFPTPLEAQPSPDWLRALLTPGAPAPLASSDEVRGAVRDLLRHGGYKPTGRGKPASEYLVRAVAENALASINAAVDACNAVSFHSGLPISVVDLELTKPPLSIQVAGPGAQYLFNASGQSIDLEGLLCLFDAEGPCANAVKDAQRTKTRGQTRRTLCVVWGTGALEGRTARTVDWYLELLGQLGAEARRL
jgi:DNA/RNA-binding domain of Phe-tRNA-synthetase-like protein